MIVTGCEVVMYVFGDHTMVGGKELRTSIVYGPTAREYVEVMMPNDGVTYKLLSVKDLKPYGEDKEARWVAQCRRKESQKHFFNDALGKEPISSGAGPHLVGAPNGGGGAQGPDRSGEEVAGDGTDHTDGDAR